MPSIEQSFDPMQVPEPVRVLVSCALALFDATTSAHRMSPEQRDSLMIAAACYAAARQVDAARPEIAGRDAVLALTHDDLTPEQRSIIASAVTFQRARLRRRREPAFLWLSSHAQTTALRWLERPTGGNSWRYLRRYRQYGSHSREHRRPAAPGQWRGSAGAAGRGGLMRGAATDLQRQKRLHLRMEPVVNEDAD